MSRTCLVIGGTGRTGRRVATLLADAGHDVIVGSRRPQPGAFPTATVDLAREFPPGLLDGIGGVVISVEPPGDSAGAQAVLNRGVARLAEQAAAESTPVVLISQIYVTREPEHPEMAGIIRARAAGEQALRESGTPYAIVRPGWLTNGPATGVRVEQGDAGEGSISRDTVASAAVSALFEPEAIGKTFELYDSDTEPGVSWPTLFAQLRPDRVGDSD